MLQSIVWEAETSYLSHICYKETRPGMTNTGHGTVLYLLSVTDLVIDDLSLSADVAWDYFFTQYFEVTTVS